jgi:hypothetical protein
MSLRQRVLPALYNGVSQQPAILRSADQNESELNTWSVLSDGVAKRPPTEIIQNLGEISNDAFIHHINRDVTERYIVVIDGGTLKVFNHLTGEPITVNFPHGTDYIASGNFRACTVADYTFIVNRSVVVSKDGLGVDAQPDPLDYAWVNNNGAGSGDDSLWARFAQAAVKKQYGANKPSGTMSGSVPSIEKLPETAPNGALYTITGSKDTGFVTFYVRRNGGVWDETVAPGLQNAIDSKTMPWALLREPDGSFTLTPFSWAPRRVGDANSNPGPTFLGRTINDVFFYQNRLGFVADESCVVSCAGDFGNFWRNTVLDYIESDVIDMAITTANVAILNYSLPFNDGIFLMADQTQFSLTNGENGMTPTSVAVQPVTHYEVNTKVRPVTIGTEAYFCGNQNGYSIVWEYTRQQDNDATTAAEITAHCPTYLPADLIKMVTATNHKALFALTGGADVYVYQFYWNGNEKLQSAWRKWTFGGDVIGGEFVGGYLYLLIRRGTDVWLERVHLEHKSKPAEQLIQVYLDRRKAITGEYNSTTDRTTFTIPYAPDQAKFRLIRGKTHPTRPGSVINPATYAWSGTKVVSVQGNEIELATCGEVYSMRLQFSQQFPVDYQSRPVSTGRLQLRTFTIYYTGTAFFRTEVSPYGLATTPNIEAVVPAKLADFTGRLVGEDDLRLNKPTFHTGSYSFQVYGDAKLATVALINDTHVASTFVSAEWEGFYFNRTTG